MLADWLAMVTDHSVYVGSMWVGSDSYIVDHYLPCATSSVKRGIMIVSVRIFVCLFVCLSVFKMR